MEGIKLLVRSFDIFGVIPEIRYNNQMKYQSTIGGVVFLVWALLIFAFFIYQFLFWIKKENMNFITSNRVVIPSPAIELAEQNFMVAFALIFDNLTIAHFDYSDFFELNFQTRIIYNASESLKVKEYIPIRKCTYKDFIEVDNATINILNLTHYYCPDYLNFTLSGQSSDDVYKWAKIEFNIKDWVLKNETAYKFISDLLSTELFRANIYFLDTSIDANDLDQPVSKILVNLFAFIDIITIKRVNMDFMKIPFTDDGSIIFQTPHTEHLMKFATYNTLQYYYPFRTTAKVDPTRLCTFYFQSGNNIITMSRQFQKAANFIASVSSISSGTLILIVTLMTYVNRLNLNREIITQTIFIKETLTNNEIFNEKIKLIKSIQDEAKFNLLKMNRELLKENNNKKIKLNTPSIKYNTEKIAPDSHKNNNSDRSSNSFVVSSRSNNQSKIKIGKLRISAFNYILCVNCKKNTFYHKAFRKGQEKLFHYLDIFTIIEKLQEVDLLKKIFLTDEQTCLADFLCKPLISVFENENTNNYENGGKNYTFDIQNLETIYNCCKSILNSKNQTDIDKKILSILEAKISLLKV